MFDWLHAIETEILHAYDCPGDRWGAACKATAAAMAERSGHGRTGNAVTHGTAQATAVLRNMHVPFSFHIVDSRGKAIHGSSRDAHLRVTTASSSARKAAPCSRMFIKLTTAGMTPSSSGMRKMPCKSASHFIFCFPKFVPMDRQDRRKLHFQLAQHYGRKCRLVFPHGDWKQHEARIASGWDYMGRDLPWDQAREAVHEGWEMVDFDARALLFSAINDEDDDEEGPGDTRRMMH